MLSLRFQGAASMALGASQPSQHSTAGRLSGDRRIQASAAPVSGLIH